MKLSQCDALERTYQTALVIWSIPCTIISILALVAMPWHAGIVQAMQMLGLFGIMPVMLSANSFIRIRSFESETPKSELKIASALLKAGLVMMAIGLLALMTSH